MNRVFSTSIFILVCVSLIGGKSHACNKAPTATICGPDTKYIKLCDWENFDGSFSSDPDGSIVKYEWDFNYNGSSFDCDYYETPSYYPDGSFDGKHRKLYYPPADTYTVKLRVTDNGGATAMDECTVHVVKIEVDVPSTYPAWVHVGHSIALESTVTPAAAGGGTYSWSKAVGAGTITFTPSDSVEDPTLSTDKSGVHRAQVDYTIGGVTVSDITTSIFVVEVELFRDSAYTEVLDDWPVDGGKPRSPKYLFREDEPIYVKVAYYAPYSDETEYYEDAVKVTSDSNPTGIYLDVKEPWDNHRDCYNQLATKELLYLYSFSSDSPTEDDKIEVQDEEVLTFYLEVPPNSGNYVESTSVMVDRAEVGAVDGTDTLDANKFWTALFTDRLWGSMGLYDKDNWPGAGDDDKCVEIGNESDFMYIAGHCWMVDDPTRICAQDNSYGLQTRGNDNNFHVADLPDVPDVPADNTWKRELDWLVLACCSTCYISHTTPRTGPGKEWVDAMDDGGTVHGVMGYEYGAPGGSTPTTDVQLADEFTSALDSKTVKDAWIDTNFAHKWATSNHVDSPLNAVAIFRDDNIDDKLAPISSQTLTQDSTDEDFTYWWIDWEEDDEDPYVVEETVEMKSFGYSP